MSQDFDRRLLLGAAGLAGIAALSRVSAAGPINPPAGPVGPTGKTLTEIEPRKTIDAANTPGDAGAVFVIAASGSYYLTDNIFVPSGKSGIRITAGDVTIDLNGFKIDGLPGSLNGITTPVAVGGTTVTIRNGTIGNMRGKGAQVYGQTLNIENVSVIDCTGIGLDVSGDVIRISRCGVFRCGGDGFLLGGPCVVDKCIAEFNTGIGFNSGNSPVFDSCSAASNTGGGFRAIFLRALNCAAVSTGGAGFLGIAGLNASSCMVIGGTTPFFVNNPEGSANISDCSAESATGVGFDLRNCLGVQLFGCVAKSCAGGGFQLGQSAAASSCVARGNGAAGFVAGGGCTFTACNAAFSGSATSLAPGFSVGANSKFENCTADNNFQHGFTVGANSTVVNCTATNSGGGVAATAGFRTTSTGVTFDSCTALSNSNGFVATGGSILTRNRSKGGAPNFNLVGTNFVGPLVTTAAGVAAASPWANFEF